MSFQLVRASDDEIVVWHTDHGHIYVFEVSSAALVPGPVRDGPDATEPASHTAGEALRFATAEALSRQLIGRSKARGLCTTGV